MTTIRGWFERPTKAKKRGWLTFTGWSQEHAGKQNPRSQSKFEKKTSALGEQTSMNVELQ